MEEHMLRQAAPAALLSATLALSACGGSRDADGVRSTFRSFYAALASPHPREACRFLTETAKRRLADHAGVANCDAVVAEVTDDIWWSFDQRDDVRRALRKVTARGVVFADAHRKAIIPEDQIVVAPPLHWTGSGSPVVLLQRHGKWLIEDLGT